MRRTARVVRPSAQIEVNAAPLLNSVVAALAEVRLEAVLIGNAAAAIQGAPVTTVDFDFMFWPQDKAVREGLETTWRERNRKP